MQRSTALRLLSPAHAELVRLADDGLHVEEIATRLSLDVSAVASALAIARAKLAALEARVEPGWADDTEENHA